MKAFFLRREVYVCQTDDGAVFMDSRSGQYFGLDMAETAAIAPHIEGWTGGIGASLDSHKIPDPDDSARILNVLSKSPALLTESSLLGKAVAPPVLQQTGSLPFRGSIVPRPRISPVDVWRFCLACLSALLDVKFRCLADTLRDVHARKSCHTSHEISRPRIVELVRIFRFLRPILYTAKDNCLFDSLALVSFLARFDIYPTWVIGVRTRPFAAHSWVLDGTLLLNEKLETAEEYFPVLAI